MKFHKELERRRFPRSRVAPKKRWLDVHVSLTIAIRDVGDGAAFKKEVQNRVNGLFHGRGGVIVRGVDIGDPHDPNAV